MKNINSSNFTGMSKSNSLLLFSLMAILLLFSGCKKDNETLSSAVVWCGFHHDWTYNHRVNRMGDWLATTSFDNSSISNYHSAASGIGPDRNDYKAYYSTIDYNSNLIEFATISDTVILQGEEETIATERVTLQANFEQKTQPVATVLLNGFDTYSRPEGSPNLVGDGDADKLNNLGISVSNIMVENNGESTLVTFEVEYSLGGNCSSPECSSGNTNDWFDYFLNAHFQVIVADASIINLGSINVSQAYSWERPMNNGTNEIFAEDFSISDQSITGLPGFEQAFVGFSSFNFQAEKGFGGFSGQSFEFPHMLTFNVAIPNIQYNSENGATNFDVDLFFKNWTRPIPIFSFGGGGSVEMDAEVIMVQVADPSMKIKHEFLQDEIIWLTNPLDPAPPNIDASLNENPIVTN